MVNTTGSDSLGGVNQSADNDFGDFGFWFEWIEFTGFAPNLTTAGFDTTDGSISPGTTLYNAGGTDDLDALATTASAQSLGDDVTGDASQFGFRVTTTLTVTNAGNYRFDVRSDDGVILFVDGEAVVSDDSRHAPRTRSGDIDLAAGDHEIVIIYFEQTGQNVMEVDIQSDAGGDYPTEIRLQDADVQANRADDTISAGEGQDTLVGGEGDDVMTGGAGNDVFVEGEGADTITDFNAGNTGSLDDGDQTNNDFVDLGGFYNSSSVTAVNAADVDPTNDFGNALGMLRADAADGRIDGIIDGTDYTSEIGDVDLTLENGGAAVTGSDLTFDNTNVVCFADGTMIETERGSRLIEELRVGDQVKTASHGMHPIRWLGRQRICETELQEKPHLRPIRIAEGALGKGMPRKPLLVSPQHRVLVRSQIVQRMFNAEEVLVAAVRLTSLEGIEVATDVRAVDYYHLLLDRHELVFSNGAITESLYLGPQTWITLPPAHVREILEIFPELRFNAPASDHLIPSGRRQRRLVQRHLKNRQPVYVQPLREGLNRVSARST